MTYTFNKFTLFEAIDKTKELGARYIETYSWQKINAPLGDMQFNYKMTDEAAAEVTKKLAASGVQLVNYYFHELGKDEAESRKVFGFCKKMGIQTIISEPDPKVLGLVDKLATEYQVKVAIHNHPKDDKHPDYANWNPDNVMKMLEGRSKWIGCCADNGHWVRAGLDSVECMRKYKGRLISLHFKDVNKVGADAHDVPYGTGVVNLKAVLTELKDQDFAGVFSIEYEHHMAKNMAAVRQCIDWFKKAKTELGVK